MGEREQEGRRSLAVRDAAAFIEAQARPNPEGFHEREIHREVRRYGSFAHVLSTVESRHDPNTEAPLYTGVNSLQLHRGEGGVWRILSLYYALEDPKEPLPASLRGR